MFSKPPFARVRSVIFALGAFRTFVRSVSTMTLPHKAATGRASRHAAGLRRARIAVAYSSLHSSIRARNAVLCAAAMAASACAGELVEQDTESGTGSAYANINYWQDARKPNALGAPAHPEATRLDGSRFEGAPVGAAGANGTGTPAAGQCGDIPAECQGEAPLALLASAACGGAACHGSPGTMGAFVDLGYDQVDLVQRLAMTMGTGMCATFPLVDASNPADSLLLQKIDGRVPCGSAMPIGRTLSDAQISCLKAWVLQEVGACL